MRIIRRLIAFIKRLFKKRNMRRKISLYIADRLVDLDDKALILFNYAMEDMTNPTIVKNSFSKQITLKGTPNNNVIFNHYYRLDKVVGDGFSPNRRIPFKVYSENNEILESGYVKLDSISRTRSSIVEYKITLYGGLGAFLYALSNNESGKKRSLADLQYRSTDNPLTELDFQINKDAVQSAWNSLLAESEDVWSVINFAPAYEGVPEGFFSADKAIVTPSSIGMAEEVVQNDVTYATIGGYGMVNLSKECTEWQVKDLRSYLQRPVLSIDAFLKAISNPQNNGGYEVDLSGISEEVFPYRKLWKTLPLIPSIKNYQKEEKELSYQASESFQSSGDVAFQLTFDYPELIAAGTEIQSILNLRLYSAYSGLADKFYLSRKLATSFNEEKVAVIIAQAVAYDASGNILGGGDIEIISGKQYQDVSADDWINVCAYTPRYRDDNTAVHISYLSEVRNSPLPDMVLPTYVFDSPIQTSVKAKDYVNVKLHLSSYSVLAGKEKNASDKRPIYATSTGLRPILFSDTGITASEIQMESSAMREVEPAKVYVNKADALRSNSQITKQILLSSSYSPADLLLSLVKIFGLHMLYDKVSNKVSIVSRNGLYKDEVVDLSDRVNVGKQMTIVPNAYSAKNYTLHLPLVGGEFAKEYESIEGIPYGMQRIDTGYAFGESEVDLLKDVVLKAGVSMLEFNPNIYVHIEDIDKGKKYPALLQEGNAKLLLYSNDDMSSVELQIPTPPKNISYVWWNDSYPGYDRQDALKIQLHEDNNKAVSGEDILLFCNTESLSYAYSDIQLSDDLPIMNVLNEGKPCWILDPPTTGLSIPSFSAYKVSLNNDVQLSLDCGIPRVLGVPGLNYTEEKTIYSNAWKKYIRDRFDVNTKVMTCYVNLRGFQVGQELLRKFYWFENSLWVMNAIKDYSLTTEEDVQCEFVQVQNKENY